jgi:hypothetical protein
LALTPLVNGLRIAKRGRDQATQLLPWSRLRTEPESDDNELR